MNALLTDVFPLSKHRPAPEPEEARDRIDLRADSSWVARVQRQADRQGLSLSAYIRQATTAKLEQDEATDPQSGDA